jgi:hypothetical protein
MVLAELSALAGAFTRSEFKLAQPDARVSKAAQQQAVTVATDGRRFMGGEVFDRC